MATRRVLIADFDFFTAIGGGQTFYRRIVERNPSMSFAYPSRGGDFEKKANGVIPNNAHPFLFNQTDQTEAYRKLFGEDGTWLRGEFGAQWATVAAALRGQRFDVLDIPSFFPIGFIARPILSAFDVEVGRVALSMLGWTSSSCRNSYQDQSDIADIYEREEIAGAGVADIRYVISNLEQDTNSRTKLPIETLDMEDTIEHVPVPSPSPRGEGPPDLWYVGRMDGAKGPDLFIEIVSRIPRSQYRACFMAGPDNDWAPNARWSAKVLRLAEERGVEVKYVGTLSDLELRRVVFGGRTVVVVPSRTDAFNYVALEALRHGCPIILSNKTGVSGFLRDQHPQLLPPIIDPADVEGAASELMLLLSNYEERAVKLRSALQLHPFRAPQTDFMARIYEANGTICPELANEASRLTDRTKLRLAKIESLNRYHASLTLPQIEELVSSGTHPHIAPKTQVPKVAIVIPVFNGLDFLGPALASALNQDYENFEVIVVDDGSTDATPNLVAQFQSDPRLRYMRKENGGVASALNYGILNTTADFICWLSHDDIFRGNKLSRQVKRFLELGREEQNTVLFSDYDLIDDSGALITTVCHRERLLGKPPATALMRGLIHGCTVFIPRAFFDSIGLFDEGRPFTQDYDLWGRASGRYNFVHMPEVLIQSRWHEGQGSKRGDYSQEAGKLWIELLDRVTLNDMVKMEGSEYGFYVRTADFLREARVGAAASEAAKRAEEALDRVKVSIVIPFYRDIEQLKAAIHSAIAQSHRNIEIIVVYDDAGQDLSAIQAMTKFEERLHVFCQNRRGAGEARNFGVKKACGQFIAFLDSDDLFLPAKIRHQLAAMLSMQARVSHTSYLGLCTDGSLSSRIFSSGRSTGNLFPDIIANCPIAMPTVMAEIEFLKEGHLFPEDAMGCEDTLLWIKVARDTEILGIDHPLSVVNLSASSIAHNPEKQAASLEIIVAALESDLELSQYKDQISHLRTLISMYGGGVRHV